MASNPSQCALDAHIAAVWAEVLGLSRVAPDDHFFELGGSSLLAAEAMERLSGILDQSLPVKALFAFPTVSELAAAIRAGAIEPERPIARAIRRPRSGAEGN